MAGFSGLVRAAIFCGVFVQGLAFCAQASAGGWTVYIQNACRNDGWVRTGFTHDNFTTEANCIRSVNARRLENQKAGFDNESFAIVYHTSPPPSGKLTSFVRGYIAHPGRCSTPKTCLFYAQMRIRGRIGYFGGYSTEAEARRIAQGIERSGQGTLIRVIKECQ